FFGGFSMSNLVKFWKDITSEDFQALLPKDSNTLYFISDTHEIYLGDKSYGSSDLFDVGSGDAEGTISFDIVDGKLVATAILSTEEGSLEVKADGLYVPPPGISLLESSTPGNFIFATSDGNIADSGLSFSTSITSESTNSQIPSAAAVYEALLRIAPIWEGIETPEDLFNWQRHNWRSFLSKLTLAENVTIDPDSFLESDGREVRLSLLLELGDYQYAPGKELFKMARFLSPPNRVVLACTPIAEDNTVSQSFEYNSAIEISDMKGIYRTNETSPKLTNTRLAISGSYLLKSLPAGTVVDGYIV
ncbi:MAG: hypothetical protein LBC41_16520, partial [Clostridiales bacterium]|nr:hypothetical protein [Clostridiales bacterium]